MIREFLGPLLLAEPVSADGVAARLAAVKGHPMAKAALETAVLDAELRAAGVSLAQRLGATRDSVECGVAVGIAGSVAGPARRGRRRTSTPGYRRVKLKIQPGWDIEPVAAFRERFGDGAAPGRRQRLVPARRRAPRSARSIRSTCC